MDRVPLAGRQVNRIGLATSTLRTTGMWGEPAGRQGAVQVIRRAVTLGAGIIEVAFPFGPGADLVRESRVAADPQVLLVVRLTGATVEPDAVRRRLGASPALVLAAQPHFERVAGWGVPVGAVIGPASGEAGPAGGGGAPGRDGGGGVAGQWPPYEEVAAVYGPFPAPGDTIARCEEQGIPYLSPSIAVLEAGRLTIALAGPQSLAELERLFADGGVSADTRTGSGNGGRDQDDRAGDDGCYLAGASSDDAGARSDDAGTAPTPPAAEPG